jgi:hypothetical protein
MDNADGDEGLTVHDKHDEKLTDDDKGQGPESGATSESED